jgi:hypothetical protein
MSTPFLVGSRWFHPGQGKGNWLFWDRQKIWREESLPLSAVKNSLVKL